MNEIEEFEFRRRRELERAGMSHSFSGSTEMPAQESKSGDFSAGLKDALLNIPRGVAQRAMDLTGNPMAGMMAQLERNRRAQEELEALTKGGKSMAHSFGKFSGDVLLPMTLGAVAGPTIPGAIGAAALSGSLRPSVSGEETLSNAATEALFAGLTTAGSRAMLPRPKIEPEHMAALVAGRKAGLDFTGGQISSNPIVQRAEAHAMWNPLTKWHLRPFVAEQDNAFVRRLMKDVGVPDTQIPRNPAFNAETMQGIKDELGKRFDGIFPGNKTIDLSLSKQPSLWKAMMRASQKPMLSEERAVVRDLVNEFRAMSSNGNVPAPIVQDMLELAAETSGRLKTSGANKGADAIDDLYKALLNTTGKADEYTKVRADYARLKTIEDLLRRSKGLGEGIPDKTKLAKSIERNMPGGLLYDRSSMAGTARGGEKSAMVGALPERSTGLPIPSDIPNAMTYFRWNNPLAKYGMFNPVPRDVAEFMVRYLPGTAVRQQTEPLAISD